jgi:hypothetical protein
MVFHLKLLNTFFTWIYVIFYHFTTDLNFFHLIQDDNFALNLFFLPSVSGSSSCDERVHGSGGGRGARDVQGVGVCKGRRRVSAWLVGEIGIKVARFEEVSMFRSSK